MGKKDQLQWANEVGDGLNKQWFGLAKQWGRILLVDQRKTTIPFGDD